MSAVALLDRLQRHGITLRAVGDELHYHPKDALTPALLSELRRHKWALLAVLAVPGDLNTAEKPGMNSNNQTGGADPAVGWRAVRMRQRHPRPWRTVPTLTVRDGQRGAGGCLSCGEALAEYPGGLAARCGPCLRAAHLVLGEEG